MNGASVRARFFPSRAEKCLRHFVANMQIISGDDESPRIMGNFDNPEKVSFLGKK